MTHQSLKLTGGVVEVETPALNEAGISSCNLIRFKPDPKGIGLPEKLGGWQRFWNSIIPNPVRALYAYQDTSSEKWMVYGTQNASEADLVAVQCFTDPSTGLTTASTDGNYIHDITPQYQSDSVAANFATTSGSSTITITDNTVLGVTQYDTVYITTPVSVGGLVLQGMYQVIAKSGNTYQITAANAIGSPTPAAYSTVTSPLTVTSATYSAGSPSTIVFHWASPNYTFRAGESLVVNGVSPVGYNGSFIVSAATSTSVTVIAGANPGAYVSGGTIANYGTTPWFQTSNGSNLVTCSMPDHGYTVGGNFYVLNETPVNGITLFGVYRVVSVPNSYSFSFFAATAATADGGQFYNAVPVTGGTGDGAHVTLTFGGASYVNQAIIPTGGSGDGAHVTLTWSSPSYIFTVGQTILVTGMSPSSWNGAYAVTSSGAGTVSYANTNAGAWVSSGAVTNAPFDLGALIWVAGVNPSAWNGYQTVTGVSANTVTYANATAGSWTGGGFISDNGGDVASIYSIGITVGSPGYGFGVGGFGVGGFGSGTTVFPAQGVEVPATTWNITNYGDYTISCPDGSDLLSYKYNSLPFQPIYAWDPSNPEQISQPLNGPPAATGVFVAMPQRQIVAWGTTFSGIIDPLLIRWCDVNSFNVWIAQITNQAGSYRIPSGSEIRGAFQTAQQALIWTDIELWSMQYLGQPYVYGFNKIGDRCGLVAKNAKAMAPMNNAVYWMGSDQFFMLNIWGITTPLPCPIWDVIFQDLDLANAWKVTCAANSLFQEVAWYYPSASEGSGEVTRYVKYNTQTGGWDYGTLGRSAWQNVSVVGQPIGADPSSGLIMQHEISNNADGQVIPATFTTGWFALMDGDQKAYVDQIWPDARWGDYGNSVTGTLNLTFTVADYPGSTQYVYGPYPVTQGTTYISPRVRGRLMSITVASDDLDSFWRLGNIRYRIQPDGRF